jgi:hypothetical protein
MSDKPREYIALLTRDAGNVQYHKDVDQGRLIGASLGAVTSGNLSRPQAYPLRLGIYSTQPCDVGALLTQAEGGERIAWRVFSDSKPLERIRGQFHNNYGGESPRSSGSESGQIASTNFPESSLDGLLTDDLFSIPQKTK